MKWKFAAAVIFGTLLVSAFGGPRPAYAAPPKDACSLLTPAQISAALGGQVGARHTMMPQVCNWSAPVRGGAPPIAVMLNLVILPAFAASKKGIGAGVAKTEEVRGIGDDAVYTSFTDPHEPPILAAKKGNAAFQIEVTGFSNDQDKAKEKTLAVEVCSKL